MSDIPWLHLTCILLLAALIWCVRRLTIRHIELEHADLRARTWYNADASPEILDSEHAVTARRVSAAAELERHRNKEALLASVQKHMRDPERTLMCDILANGQLLPNAGNRYGFPTTGKEHLQKRTGMKKKTEERPELCNLVRQDGDDAYPRTCELCGLGPCPYESREPDPECDFDGANLRTGDQTVRLQRYASTVTFDALAGLKPGHVMWDVATGTLYHRNGDGTLWEADWTQIDDENDDSKTS